MIKNYKAFVGSFNYRVVLQLFENISCVLLSMCALGSCALRSCHRPKDATITIKYIVRIGTSSHNFYRSRFRLRYNNKTYVFRFGSDFRFTVFIYVPSFQWKTVGTLTKTDFPKIFSKKPLAYKNWLFQKFVSSGFRSGKKFGSSRFSIFFTGLPVTELNRRLAKVTTSMTFVNCRPFEIVIEE